MIRPSWWRWIVAIPFAVPIGLFFCAGWIIALGFDCVFDVGNYLTRNRP